MFGTSSAIRELKKAQDILGDLHDRQELIDHLASVVVAANPETDDGAQVALIRQVVNAEARAICIAGISNGAIACVASVATSSTPSPRVIAR